MSSAERNSEERGETPEREAVDDLLGALQSSVTAARLLLADLLGLAVLETRLAALSVVQMLALAVVAGFVLMAGWLLLQGALTVALMRVGVPLDLSLFGLALFNLLLAWLSVRRIRRSTENIGFGALRRALHPAKHNAATETADR